MRALQAPHRAKESEILFTLIAERYEHRSLGITWNLLFSEWEKIFANLMATTAIDRAVHNSAILEFDVPSQKPKSALNCHTDKESQTAQNK